MIRARQAADLDRCVSALRATSGAAVAFYEATGWRRTHTADADWAGPDGGPVRLRHYIDVA